MAVVTKKRLLLLVLAAVGAWWARQRSAPTPAPAVTPYRPTPAPAETPAATVPDLAPAATEVPAPSELSGVVTEAAALADVSEDATVDATVDAAVADTDEPELEEQVDAVLESETPGPLAVVVEPTASETTASETEPARTIKGNADSGLFHTEDSPYYAQTAAEQWFATEDEARAAGFVRWNDRSFPPPAPVREGAYGPGSAAPLDGGGSPSPAYTIKGNAGSKLFHTPESPYYRRTKAEVWFADEDTARTAGFRKWSDPKA